MSIVSSSYSRPSKPTARAWASVGVPDSDFGEGVYCPQCGYHLRGIAEIACPECGFAYDHCGVRCVARHEATREDAAARRGILGGAFACACFLSDGLAGQWSSKTAEFLSVLLACVCAVGLYWYYRDLRPPSPWTVFWKLMSYLGCFDVAVVLTALPEVGRVVGLLFCGHAWMSMLVLRSSFPAALSAIDAGDRACVQFRTVFALALLVLSSALGISAWV